MNSRPGTMPGGNDRSELPGWYPARNEQAARHRTHLRLQYIAIAPTFGNTSPIGAQWKPAAKPGRSPQGFTPATAKPTADGGFLVSFAVV